MPPKALVHIPFIEYRVVNYWSDRQNKKKPAFSYKTFTKEKLQNVFFDFCLHVFNKLFIDLFI
jgi:hypothetical protein